MRPFGFFDHRFRGFRVVELGGLVVLLILILTVYLAKTGAGGKRADIDRIQAQIFDEQTQIRMLRAEVATLEQPQRLEALSSRYLGLQPISARREVTPEGLQDVARVAVVDHKPSLVANDPLTQVGSPDLLPGQTGATAAPKTAPAPPPLTPAPDPDQTVAEGPSIMLAQVSPIPARRRAPAHASAAPKPKAAPAPAAADEPAPVEPAAAEAPR
jgi:cell division protein FtsL